MNPLVSIVHDIPKGNLAGGVHRYTNEIISGLNSSGIPTESFYIGKGEISILGRKNFGTLSKILQYQFQHPNGKIIHSMSLSTMVKKSNFITVHDLIRQKLPNLYTSRKFYDNFIAKRLSLALRQNIIVHTQSVKNDLIEIYDVDPDRIFVVYPFIDTTVFMNTMRNPYPDNGNIHIVSITDFDSRKILTPIIKAVLNFDHADLYIIGGSNANKQNEERYRRLASDSEKINFLGRLPQQDVVDYFSNADFMVHGTLDEGFGYPPLEAMACGVTPVVTDIPVLHETLGDNAIYFNAENDRATEELLEIMNSFPKLRREKEVLLNYVNKFSIENLSDALVSAYSTVSDELLKYVETNQ